MPIATDALIIGAGPCGLFQIFELGLLGIRTHVVESLPEIGGQCTFLYPDKPIYDIPAVPICTGDELIQRLLEQTKPFEPQFHLDQEVTQVSRRNDGGFDVRTSAGIEFNARTVFIAGGVGSFQPSRLNLGGLTELEDKSVFYKVTDPTQHAGKRLVILGGGDSALDWTLELVDKAQSVLLVHRRDGFRAAPASVEKMRALCDAGKMRFEIGRITAYEAPAGQLESITVTDSDGATRQEALDQLLIFFGLSPKLGPIAEWGLELQRKRVLVDTARFETSIPGIYAIGDINHYEGKKKLILSGFHEAALAAFAAKERLEPGKKVHVQYTTTSPLMHERLGVESPYEEDEPH